MVYLAQGSSSPISLLDLKERIFPEKPLILKYRVNKTESYNESSATYIFEVPRPQLPLKLDKEGKYFFLTAKSINRILKELKLPEVKEGVPELIALTGIRHHNSQFRWDKYAKGTMIVEKEMCQGVDSITIFQCLVQITITKKY